MREVAVTAVGSDRPGIVAAITEALRDLGGNLADCRAALLAGSFAIVVVAELPDDVSDDTLRAALAEGSSNLGLGVWVGPAQRATAHADAERCIVSVYGADHPGIVAAVSRAVADLGVNIVDLSSRVVGDPAIYVLGLEVELATGMTATDLEARLQPVATAQGVELAVEAEADEVI
jgi:glycine cleavage system transcriptional repressor